MPPPGVEVVTVTTTPVENIVELPGRVQAIRTAEVRARVNGIVDRKLYREGGEVKAGQPLFAIDPREMRANLASAEATLKRTEAQALNARQNVERYRPLLQGQAISKQEYDAAIATLNSAEADVLQAQAQVENARLNLGYTTVTAPIAGRAGRALVTEGALVSAAEATLLTVVDQVSPIYVNLSEASSDVLAFQRAIQSGALKLPSLDRVQVDLELEDGSSFSQTGRIDFVSPSLDQSTGSFELRAEFPNPGGLLLPGQFVRARVHAGTRPNAVLLPQRAVTVAPNGGAVMVVGKDDIAEARPVRLGDLRGSEWLILDGLKAGERVITSGLQKVQPGAPVRILNGAEAQGAPKGAPAKAPPAAKGN